MAAESTGAAQGGTGDVTTPGGGGAPAPEGVRAFDQEGREVIVPRDQWRTEVLPGMIKESWDNPEQLYVLIINSLNDNFASEIAPAAEHLFEIDPLPARGACMWGIVLAQTGRRDEAQKVFEDFTENKGEDGSVLVNLARLYFDAGDLERSRTTLDQAIEIEPNHDNGLGWYASQAGERGGDEAVRKALEHVAAMPNSWRAQLWLARGELNQGNLGNAGRLYTEALNRTPKPVPPDALMQISGDLGSKGHLLELISFTAPHFVPEWHGIAIGNNLIKALVDTGNLDPAEQVRAALAAVNRPDWRDALAFWEGEISRRRGAAGAPGAQGELPGGPQGQEIQIGMLRIEGPIWSPPGSPARFLFSAKDANAPRVTFMGGTAEAPQEPGENRLQLADRIGRMTRSLPLFFAEQVQMRTAATGRAMLPWAVGAASGFVVSGQRWPDATAVEAVSVPENQSEYVVTVHLDAEVEPWTAMLGFVRASDGSRIGELEAEFDPESPETGLADLADEVVELLSVLGPATLSPAYEVPGPTAFSSYLVSLEQMLATRCAAMDGVPPAFLTGEREILESQLRLCADEPENIPARLILLGTYGTLKRIRPSVETEFGPRIATLKADLPLPAADSLEV